MAKSRFLILGLLAAAAAAFLTGAEPVCPLPGQIVIDPEHPQWLKRQGGKHVFICGPGDPEDFLYRGRRRPDGSRDGDQLALIRKLIEHGGNSIYLQLVRTHGGDARQDQTHNPFVDSDPAKGLDEDILAQWEEWFSLMDRHDILIYLFFYDDGARIWDTGDEAGPEEEAFLEAIVRRFKHHKNLIWLVGEESEERYSNARVQAIARVIRRTDNYGHVIGNHHLSGTAFKAWQAGGPLNHYSMQLTRADDEAHAGAVEAFEKAAGRYQVIYSESTAMRTDVDGMRRHAWSVAMGGLMPMLLNMDIAQTSPEALRQCRYLQRFFEATDFFTMAPHDELKHAGTKWVLANPGVSYIAYADDLSERMGLRDLPAGRYRVTWIDARTGVTKSADHIVKAAGSQSFERPEGIGRECAAWVRLRAPDSSPARRTDRERQGSTNRPPAVTDRKITAGGEQTYTQLTFEDDDGPGPYSAPEGALEYFPPPESKGGWRRLTQPRDVRELAGMDPDKLSELRDWLLASDKRDFAAVVIRNGYVVLDVERGNSARTDSRRVASVSKAVCATVLAIAAERSRRGLTPKKMTFDDPAFEFVPWAMPLSDPRKANITVKQLLNHTSGICPEALGAPNDGAWEYILGHSGDARTSRLAFDPGTASGYSTHAFHHAALVCETVTGRPYDEFAVESLFRPIGVEHWWFQFFEGGERYGRHPSHGLGMPALDLARIAYCMLRGGRWSETQVIPKWFVEETGAPTHNVEGLEMRFKRNAQSFSHGWELPARLAGESERGDIPADARYKPGSGGQLIAFVPSIDLVVTRQTGGSGAWEYEEYLRRACRAVLRPKRK